MKCEAGVQLEPTTSCGLLCKHTLNSCCAICFNKKTNSDQRNIAFEACLAIETRACLFRLCTRTANLILFDQNQFLIREN